MLKGLTLLLFAIILIGCTTIQSISDDNLKLLSEKSFSVEPGGNLIVKSTAGTVKISSWDNNTASVKVYGNDNAQEQMDFDVTQTGNDVKVTGKMKSKDKSGSELNVRYEIILPRQFNAEIDTKGGNINITEVKGKFTTNTMGGNISFEHTEGEIDANTMGGNIHMESSNGKIQANTMGGNIHLEYAGENKGIELNTMGGNIHATLPSDINGDADFSTAAGKISCDFAEPRKDFASQSLKTKFNNGGEPISINTAAGNIHVEKKQ